MARIQSRVSATVCLRLMVALSICFQGCVSRDLSAFAQENASEAEILFLARSLGAQLRGANLKSVVVFDLRGPEDQWLPFGSWLADQISMALANTGQQLQVIDRVRLAAEMKTRNLSGGDTLRTPMRAQISEAVEADGFITGSFGPFKDQVGITLVAWRTSDAKQSKGFPYAFMLNGKVPLGPEETSHLTVPLESLRPIDGIFRGGYAGTTVPQCEYCPAPQFSTAAIWRNKGRSVVLNILVSPEGYATQVKVAQSPDPELDSEAIKAVEGYKFKAAVDPDGEPIAVRMPFVIGIRVANSS
jgi:TonB family protein